MRRTLRTTAVAVATAVLATAPLPLGAQLGDALPSPREAVAGAVLLGAALALDRTVAGSVPEGGGERWEGVTALLDHGGRPGYALLLVAGTAAAGTLTGEDRVRDGALRVAGGILVAGAMNGAMKYASGRERPNATEDPFRFRPPGRVNRWQAFPSGHTVVAFSVASTLTEETGSPVVGLLTYTGAVLVGASRVYDDRHWTSDVVGGALLGIWAGRGTVRLLRGMGGDDTTPTLSVTPSGVQLRIPVG